MKKGQDERRGAHGKGGGGESSEVEVELREGGGIGRGSREGRGGWRATAKMANVSSSTVYHQHDRHSIVRLSYLSLRPDMPDAVISFPQLYSSTMLRFCDIKTSLCDIFSRILNSRSLTSQIIPAQHKKSLLRRHSLIL